MRFVVLAALCLIPISPAFAEGETTETPKLTETTVEPPTVSEEANLGLFDRVRGAHTRAVQRGIIVVTAPKS